VFGLGEVIHLGIGRIFKYGYVDFGIVHDIDD